MQPPSINQALINTRAKLAKINASHEAEPLLCHILNTSPTQLITKGSSLLTSSQHTRLTSLINQRTTERIPLAYLTNRAHIFDLTLTVTPDTLIPRPETEELIEHALKILNSYPTPQPIIDIATGSGAIPIAIHHLATTPPTDITATDISIAAINIARQNAKTHHTPITFITSNLLTNVPDKPTTLLTANLPYVSESEYKEIDPELVHEPKSALTPPTPQPTTSNGTELIAKLITQISPRAHQPKHILLEIGSTQAKHIHKLVADSLPNYSCITHQDLQQKDRIIELTKTT